MASVSVQASFKLNTGEVVDMKTTMTEGTESELLTSTKYSVSAVSIGTFAEGKVLSQILQPPTAPNGISYAYIDRRGEILCIVPVAVAGVQDEPMPMLRTFALQAGDTLRVMASTAASKAFAYNAVTSGGVHSIFAVTPTTANDYEVLHIKSGQGLGASLTGQQIACHFATSVQGSALDSGGGLYILSDRGLPIGGVTAVNPINLPIVKSYMGGAMIGLNFVGRVTTNA
jgi:hypothetical protein